MKRLLLFLLLLGPPTANADSLSIEILGVEGELAVNIDAHVGSRFVSGAALATERRRVRFVAEAKARAASALRPFGYYFPEIQARLAAAGDDSWKLQLNVEKGAPVTVDELLLEITGPGSELESLLSWAAEWPLQPGARLDQPLWEELKQTALDYAEENGYLGAKFQAQEINLNLETNQADLVLILETGPQATMGTVEYIQDQVEEGVLTPIPRFQQGDPYQSWLVEKLRTDIWRSGSWDEIDVTEERLLDQQPPVVNFRVVLTPGKRNRHQGTVGYGTDTEFRMQYRWQHHLLSERDDALSAGFGWQTRNEELILFGEYRLPRQVNTQQYWALTPILKREHQDIDIDVEGESDSVRIGSGRVDDFTLRLGKVKLRNLSFSREQIIETMYAQYLREADDFDLVLPVNFTGPQFPAGSTEVDSFGNSRHSLSFGMEWDWPVVQGRGFQTRGHRERAWFFTSNEAWGSDVDYSQVYLSTRWEIPAGDRWKFLFRGELGYSDADVLDAEVEVDDRLLQLSVTELPFLYRFKAGGSLSVRGYDFESLSNNGIGSNNLITASAEVEYLFIEDWSAAAFVDVGNAFNEWDNTSLKKGFGVGVRWYTIAGALRLDVAQARDLDGSPWRIHFTIGTPLL